MELNVVDRSIGDEISSGCDDHEEKLKQQKENDNQKQNENEKHGDNDENSTEHDNSDECNNVTLHGQEQQKREQKNELRKRVQFSTIEIREYPIVLGDNPAVSHGPPLSISWEYDVLIKCNVDDYERHYCNDHYRRRGSELRIPYKIRNCTLHDMGYSNYEIKSTMKEVQKLQLQRSRTVTTLRLQPVHEIIEKITRNKKKKHGERKNDVKECAYYDI